MMKENDSIKGIMTNLEIQAKVGEIAIDLLERKSPIIKITANNKITGKLVFTVYGIVRAVDHYYIVFDKKYWMQNNVLIPDKNNQEAYTKDSFEYAIKSYNEFVSQDYYNLLTIALLDESMPFQIYDIISRYLIKCNTNDSISS